VKRRWIGLVISVPALAVAQPGMTPPIDPPPTNQPAGQTPPTGRPPSPTQDRAPEREPIQVPIGQPPPAPGDTPPPPPNLPPPPPGGPPPPSWTPRPMVGNQPLGYAPGYGPDYTSFGPPPGLAQYRHGVTFEANLGLAVSWLTADGSTSDSKGGGTLGLGLGGWITNRMALSARFVESGFSADGDGASSDDSVYGGFFGPSLQLWLDDHVFLGGGLGWSFLGAKVNGTNTDTETGFGLDLRLGYNFTSRSPNTFNVSLELTPGFYNVDLGNGQSQDFRFNVFTVLVGYQHL
jgi:hypothetical protein